MTDLAILLDGPELRCTPYERANKADITANRRNTTMSVMAMPVPDLIDYRLRSTM
jgi:hypothetical protein